MRLSLFSLVRFIFFLLLPISLISTVYIYAYPYFQSCSYPNPTAPFRLLTLADPQLEGDTSIYSARYGASHPVVREFRRLRKTVDLWGNDYYLAHIFRSLYTWSEYLVGGGKPTHVVVLGDLIGSQWIDDGEFASRSQRYWGRVLPAGKKVTLEDVNGDVTPDDGAQETNWWSDRIINVAGNHDIGYAGDMTPHLLERFESTYGPSNYVFTHTLPDMDGRGFTPQLRIINLNDLHLDGPVYDKKLQQDTYNFLNEALFAHSDQLNDTTTATVLLTHVPLHKEHGICVDGPMTTYHEYQIDGLNPIREQNHISSDQSRMLLDMLFHARKTTSASRQGGIILTGHDHEGCDTWHYLDHQQEGLEGGEGSEEGERLQWTAIQYTNRSELERYQCKNTPPNSNIGVREITVRSMMGEFGGNAGFLSAWYDYDLMTWKFDYASCPFGVQHIWWAVHAVLFSTFIFGLLYSLLLYQKHLARVKLRKNVPKVVITMVDMEVKEPVFDHNQWEKGKDGDKVKGEAKKEKVVKIETEVVDEKKVMEDKVKAEVDEKGKIEDDVEKVVETI